MVEDFLVTDPITGGRTRFGETVKRALEAMSAARVPFSVIGAAALAARGFPRMTVDLDLAVLAETGPTAIAALVAAGLRQETPAGSSDDPAPMIVWRDPATGTEVDLLLAVGDPEATVIDESPRCELFGAWAPVATLEHLLLLYLYSNQPRHLGDFTTIVRSGRADLDAAARLLSAMHPEMLEDWRQRLEAARTLPPAPPRPARRRPR